MQRAGSSAPPISCEPFAGLEEQLHALIENLPFDVWMCNAEGRYVVQNATSIRRWGNQLGKHPSELGLPPHVIASWVSNNLRAQSGEIVRGEIEYAVEGRTGTYFQIIAPIQTSRGIVGSVGVNLDVSERRAAERERDRLVIELQGSLERLRKAQEDVVQRERLAAVGEVAAILAHEIRNPLAAIANCVAALTRSVEAKGDAAVLLEILREEAARLDGLVGTLLDLTRPMSLNLAPNRLDRVVDAAWTAASRAHAHEAAALRVERAFDPATPELVFDKQWVQMAVVNLITNAIQSTPAGGLVRLAVHPHEHEGMAGGCATISDTGHGIPSELAARVFEPFFTTRARGTGLGLALVKRVAEAHGGNASLTSDGSGTTVSLWLPCSRPLASLAP